MPSKDLMYLVGQENMTLFCLLKLLLDFDRPPTHYTLKLKEGIGNTKHICSYPKELHVKSGEISKKIAGKVAFLHHYLFPLIFHYSIHVPTSFLVACLIIRQFRLDNKSQCWYKTCKAFRLQNQLLQFTRVSSISKNRAFF